MSETKEHRIQIIEIPEENKLKIVLKNIIIMLSNRNIINKDKIDYYYKLLLDSINDDLYFEFTPENDNKKYIIKFIKQKLTTIKKIPGLEQLSYDKSTHKIFVVQEMSKKAYEQLTETTYSEVFYDNELMIDIISHHYQPKFELLTKEQMNEILIEYQVKKKDLPRMLQSDAVARYFFLSPGDIIRIIRPSITTGEAPFYRIVIPKSLFA